MMTVTPDDTPDFSLSTAGPLLRPENYPPRHFNFHLVRAADLDGVTHPDLSQAHSFLPGGYQAFPCPAARTEIRVYDDDRLDTYLQDNIAYFRFLKQHVDIVTFTARELEGATGRLEGGSRSARDGDAAGFLARGPYREIPPGRYRLDIAYAASEGAGLWEAGVWDDPTITAPTILAKGDFAPAEKGVASVVLDLPPGVLNFETRSIYSGHGRLMVHSVKLTRVGF
jgi:hypothetical protein